MSVYDYTVQTIDGVEKALADYQGKVLLVVNTASRCGFTPQYQGLQHLYEQYRASGLEVLGFPCNQFGGQEPGTNAEIQQFCEANYRVTFPMFAKIDVNGADAHPLYEYLKSSSSGVLGTKAIKWNFTKFLIGKDGQVLDRYAPGTSPEEIAPHIERALAR